MTKKLAVLLLLALCWTVVALGQNRKSRFDPDGSFWIHGTAPDGFSDFGGINLNAKRLRRLPGPGLQLNNGKNFRYKALSVKQDSFTFSTVSVSNISYSFSGKFLRGGVFESAGLDDETPVLEGVLTKFKGNRKISEAKLKFVYFGGT
jgi:hypothetical protein